MNTFMRAAIATSFMRAPVEQPSEPAAPTVQSSNLSFTGVGRNSVTPAIGNRGNGEAVLVVARIGEPVTQFPINGQSYTSSEVFGEGDEVGIGNFVIHNGDGTIEEITGLLPGQELFVRAFERNGTLYNTDPAVGNPAVQQLLAFPLGDAFREVASDYLDWTFDSESDGAAFTGGINHGTWGDAEIGFTNPPTRDLSRGAVRLTKADGESIKFAKPVNYSNPNEFMMVLEVIPSSDFVTNIHTGNTSETANFMTINSSEQVSINGVNTGVVLTAAKTAIRVHIENGTNASYIQINKGSKVTFTTTVNNGNTAIWVGSKHSTVNTTNGYLWAYGANQGAVSDEDWEAIVDYYIT